MTAAPTPDKIYERAKAEGERRLSASMLEKSSTGFIAGVTIVFGVVALGLVESLIQPSAGDGPAKLAGALAFGTGLVLLVVGRTELFTENFFDPVAAAAGESDRSPAARIGRLTGLWAVVLVFNLIGGAVMVGLFCIEGALPAGAHEALVTVAEDLTAKSGWSTFARGVAAGTLLTLLSFLLHAVDSVGARAMLAYLVGFLLALGPFDHVVVSVLHLFFGAWLGGDVGYGDIVENVAVAGAGNLVGGLLLMTLTHAVQARGARGR